LANPVSPVGLASYPHVYTPNDFDKSNPKYEITLLFPKSDPDALTTIKEACRRAAAEKFGSSIPANLDSPIRDGDKKADKSPEYAGMHYVKFTSKQPPHVVKKSGGQTVPLPASEDKIYGGAKVCVSFSPYGWEYMGKTGVSCGLRAVLFVEDGERFGGGGCDPDEDFGGVQTPATAGAASSDDLPF
jgi:hypothetical protein